MAKKLKKKFKPRRAAGPLFTLGGYDISLTHLLISLGVVFTVIATICLFMLTPLGSVFASKPDVRAVDAYVAVNSMGWTKVGERFLSSGSTPMKVPGPSVILVTKPNPAGKYLWMKVSIPSSEVASYFKGAGAFVILSGRNLTLKDGNKELEPLLLQDRSKDGQFHMSFNPPERENGPPANLLDYLGPGKEIYNNHTTTGKMVEASGGAGATFKSDSGMEVTLNAGSERQDGKENSNPLSGLIGGNLKTGLGGGGLMSSPSAYVKVTWNGGCDGYMAGHELEQPNDLSRYWDVYCIFPRPEQSGETMLTVLGKPRKIKLP